MTAATVIRGDSRSRRPGGDDLRDPVRVRPRGVQPPTRRPERPGAGRSPLLSRSWDRGCRVGRGAARSGTAASGWSLRWCWLLIILSLSRLAFAASLLIIVIGSLDLRTPGRLVRSVLVVGAVAGLAYFSVTSFGPLASRFRPQGDLKTVGGVSVDVTGRTNLWRVTWVSYLHSPIIGQGAGSAETVIDQARGLATASRMTTTFGCFTTTGSSAWRSFLGRSPGCWDMRAARRASAKGDPAAPIDLAAGLSVVGLLAAMATDNAISTLRRDSDRGHRRVLDRRGPGGRHCAEAVGRPGAAGGCFIARECASPAAGLHDGPSRPPRNLFLRRHATRTARLPRGQCAPSKSLHGRLGRSAAGDRVTSPRRAEPRRAWCRRSGSGDPAGDDLGLRARRLGGPFRDQQEPRHRRSPANRLSS